VSFLQQEGGKVKMASDDTLDKRPDQLDQEIDSKVDSLFTEEEGAQPEQAAPASEKDHLKGLKEHFLALEWEIDPGTLDKILLEVKRLRAHYSEGPLALLLGWMEQVAERIRAQGSEVDQDTMKLFHRMRDGFLSLAEDPAQDSEPIVNPLREEVERLFGPVEEEEPTITLETAAGEEELLFEELDRIMEETPAAEGEPLAEEAGVSEIAGERGEIPVALQETVEDEMVEVSESVEDTALEAAEEFSWEEEAEIDVVEEPASEVVRETPDQDIEVDEVETIRAALAEGGGELQRLVEAFQGPDGPMGMTSIFEDAGARMRQFAESLQSTVVSLQRQIQTLQTIEYAPKPREAEPSREPDLGREEILFVSVSNRIFGIPLESVQGIFRVPSDAVPQVLNKNDITLKGKAVPIVPLWRKIGLGKELYTFPKEEKRILLISTGKGELGLLVDRVLAREDIALKPVKDEDRVLFKGLVSVEKWAFVVDPEAL
jgi:chemotaxis protein histidine kinase CheA